MSYGGEIQRRNQDPFLIIYFCVKASQSKEKYSMTCPITELKVRCERETDRLYLAKELKYKI
ncbi:hypothetical protein BHQ88_23415, partial [Salmonella enterica subsp. enterica serovar Goldcoast]|nr:hypothetical protein [Salmonella enterica subsp. enterica serovar Goldcoast]